MLVAIQLSEIGTFLSEGVSLTPLWSNIVWNELQRNHKKIPRFWCVCLSKCVCVKDEFSLWKLLFMSVPSKYVNITNSLFLHSHFIFNLNHWFTTHDKHVKKQHNEKKKIFIKAQTIKYLLSVKLRSYCLTFINLGKSWFWVSQQNALVFAIPLF